LSMSTIEITRSLRAIAWFLAVSYSIGAPLGAFVELRGSFLSTRFGLPAGLIYLVSAIQLACALLILSRRHASLAAMVLSVTTIGAAASHLRIGSPLTSIPALLFTAVQVWFALRYCAIRRSASLGSP
jgi:hypothetical protein